MVINVSLWELNYVNLYFHIIDLCMCKMFLLKGADANCVNKEGQPVLTVAVLNKHVDAIEPLVDGGATVDKKGPK